MGGLSGRDKSKERKAVFISLMLIYRLAVRILIDLIVVLCICVLTCAASSATPHCCSYYKEMAGHRNCH